jgi:hypothetical protein
MTRFKLGLSLLICFIAVISYIGDGQTSHAATTAVRVSIHRAHKGDDCTSGQILIDDKIIAYSLERPWEGNIPLISSIPAGRYHGFVRTKTKDRWRIELTDVPDRTNIQLHIGNFLSDGVGCIMIGSNLTKNLCQLVDGEAGFNSFKLAFAAAAARLGQKDVDTPVELVIEDQA